jgi:hypothetical protein
VSEDYHSLRVPTFCPICSGLMKGKSTNTYYDHGCCISCHIFFIEGRPERWEAGWRPSPEDIERMRVSMGR